MTAAQSATADAAEQARQNAITDRYLTEVKVAMVGRVDTAKAVAGQEVSVKTLAEVRLADGTTLPKGTRLVGHVIQTKAGGAELGGAVLAMTFDHAEVKPGQSLAVRSVIRSVARDGAGPSRDMMPTPPMMSTADVPGGATGRGGVAGGMPGTTIPTIGGVGNRGSVGSTMPMPGSADDGRMGRGSGIPSATDPMPTIGGRQVAMNPPSASGAGTPSDRRVAEAGETKAGAPRPTGLEGVLLWATPTASGTLTAAGRNISLEAGTPMTLGVITR